MGRLAACPRDSHLWRQNHWNTAVLTVFRRDLQAKSEASLVFRGIYAYAGTANRPPLKESAEERRRFIRDADNLVRCLTIKFEIELGLGSTVVPVGEKFEFASPQVPLRQRGASDGYAHSRRLPGDPAFLCDRFGRGDDAARDETWPAFILAREDEDRIAFGDPLATIHRLLRAERERLRPLIANLGFNREHQSPLPSAKRFSWSRSCSEETFSSSDGSGSS